MKAVRLLPLLLIPTLAVAQNSLLNQPIPLLPNKTLDGSTIDKNFYKGHLTVVNFMAIGCMPCMDEIGVMNRLNDEYKGTEVQFLSVARQMKDQMVQFNEDTTSVFGVLRKALKVEKIRYPIQPSCPDAQSKMVVTGTDSARDYSLKTECDIMMTTYNINAVPTTFFVDKDGIIRKITVGGPPAQHDQKFYEEIRDEIEKLRKR